MADSTSILDSVKTYLGVPNEVDSFDDEISLAINSALNSAWQLGALSSVPIMVGPENKKSWVDLPFSGNASADVESILRDYVFSKAKLQFDPPANGFLVTPIKDHITELEYRLSSISEGDFND